MSEQMKVVSLSCPNCGGALEIHGDMEQFACGYCGSAQTVERRGGTIALRLVADAVARVQAGTDKTAAELAIVRLEKEIASIYALWQANRNKFIVRQTGKFTGVVDLFRESFTGKVNGLEAKLAEFDAPYQRRLSEIDQLIQRNREIVDGP